MPQVSPEAALARTTRLAELAKTANFEELARRYSEDVVTASRGGSLDGIAAAYLPAEFLDAVAELKVGEVSHVVQTPMGFHILRRNAPRNDGEVAGRRILFRYASTLPMDSDFSPVARSRSEALRQATEIARTAKADRALFEALLKQHSEAPDPERRGHFYARLGEPNSPTTAYLGLAMQALSIGEVGDPVETPEGFQVPLRTPPRNEPLYAMQILAVTPSMSRSQATRRKMIDDLSRAVNAEPAEFDDLRRAHCCLKPLRWTPGLGFKVTESALAKLAIGRIAQAPIDDGEILLIPRRIAPDDPAFEAPLPELPKPAHVNLDRLIAGNKGAALAQEAEGLSGPVRRILSLPKDADAQLMRILAELKAGFGASLGPESNMAAWNTARTKSDEALGLATSNRVWETVQSLVDERALKSDR